MNEKVTEDTTSLWAKLRIHPFFILTTIMFVYPFISGGIKGGDTALTVVPPVMIVLAIFADKYILRELRSSNLYQVLKKRDIPEERAKRIRVDWHKFRRDNSRWQEFIETKLDYEDFSPVEDMGVENLIYSHLVMGDLSKGITLERLKNDKKLYVYFIDCYYDEFESNWEEKTLATIEPEIDEGTIERRRRRLEEHLAEDKVLREADKEYLRDTLRGAVEKHREYVANKKAIKRLNLPEDEKEEVKEELKERYEEIREEEGEKEEEKRG